MDTWEFASQRVFGLSAAPRLLGRTRQSRGGASQIIRDR